MKYIKYLLPVILTTGCATTYKFTEKMNGFIGKPELKAVEIYGPPNSSYTLQDGTRVISYTKSGQTVIPGMITNQPITTNTTGNLNLNQGLRQTTGSYNQQSTTYVQQQEPSIEINYKCTVNFTIDKSGIIQAWNSSGNHCVSN